MSPDIEFCGLIACKAFNFESIVRAASGEVIGKFGGGER